MSNFLDRKKSKDKQANWIFFALGIIVILCVIYFSYKIMTFIKLSEEDGCPEIDGARGTTVILFDNTDKYEPVIEADIKAHLFKIKDSVKKYQKLAIYIITEDAKNIKPQIEICNPGSMADKSKFAFLNSNPKKIKDRWEKKFSKEVDKILNDLLVGGTSEWSPIFEMIQAVNISSFKHSNENFRDENKLYIFSDFIHNTPEFSQYKNKSNFETFKKNNLNYYEKIYSMLRGTFVQLYVVNRLQSESIESMNNFWKDFFVATKAKNRLPYIEYMGK